jgi:TetR/AcrR family transcriptional regulator of autoinduction and epiphytic fitness
VTARKERAAATRARIIAAAHELFASVGYNGTTMRAVAKRAGVAVQTVYFVFHTKAELLGATAEDVAAGSPSPVPVPKRPWFRDSVETGDARRTIALAVEHGVDIYRRSAPLAHAIREAALTDPEVHELWSRIEASRKRGMRLQIERIAAIEQLREGLDVDRATDVMHAMVSHETYLELVRSSGWPVADYKAWLYGSVCWMLLREDLADATDADATRGLSFADQVNR